ncbi:hypothetical protein ACP70R_018593 [Stipagrostis hirtigluma subsp. patula]
MATGPTQPLFPEEIMEEIFLRLDAADDLARASAACASFRRVVRARRFLRHFRSLHPPPVVGFLNFGAPGGFHSAEPPRRSAPAARALAQAADFTFSFLPSPNCWGVADARDGRVLLYRRMSATVAFMDLVVCDPLHRRYVQIPLIPDDLAASTGGCNLQEYEPFLFPASEKEEEVVEDKYLSFQLICAVQRQDKLVIFQFSSATGEWRGDTFHRTKPLPCSLDFMPELLERHYAHGCFFWTSSSIGSFMFMFDMREMKLSLVDLPPRGPSGIQMEAIVEAGEGMFGLLFLGGGDKLDLYCKDLRSNGIGSEEWKHEKIIPLPESESDCYWHILSVAEGCVLLQATPQKSSQMLESQYFTLDLKTMLVERLCVSTHHINGAHLYASLPPLLSLPSL